MLWIGLAAESFYTAVRLPVKLFRKRQLVIPRTVASTKTELRPTYTCTELNFNCKVSQYSTRCCQGTLDVLPNSLQGCRYLHHLTGSIETWALVFTRSNLLDPQLESYRHLYVDLLTVNKSIYLTPGVKLHP